MPGGSRRPSNASPTRTRSRGSPKPSLPHVATLASRPPSAPNSRKGSKSGKSRGSRDGETFALSKVLETPRINETSITSVLNTQPLVGPSSVLYTRAQPSPQRELTHRHPGQAISANEIQQICVAEDRSLRDEIERLRAEHKLQLETEIAKVHTAWEARIAKQESILSFMQDSMGRLTRRNDERTSCGEDLRLLHEDVNCILEFGVTPGLTEMVEDLGDRIDNLEEFVTSKNSDPTGFIDVGDPYTRPGSSVRVKNSHRQKAKHPPRVKHRRKSHIGHEDLEDSDHTRSSSSSSSPDSDKSNKDHTHRNGYSTSSHTGSSSDDQYHNSRSRKSRKSKYSNRSSRTRMDETTHVVPDIHNRRKGPKHEGLKELRPTNLLFRSLLSYRTYR